MALDSPEGMPTGWAEQRMPRVAGAALLIIAAGLHIYEYFGAPLSLAALFIASAAGTVAGAVLLLAKSPLLGWLIGGGASALTFAGYCLTRTIGIPGVDPSADIGNWLQPLGVVSLIAEGGALLLAVIALSGRNSLSTQRARAELTASTPGRIDGSRAHR